MHHCVSPFIIIKIDDVDGLSIVLESDCFLGLAIHHNVLINLKHSDRDSFHEQVLFLVWKRRELWLVKSEPTESPIILEEEDEKDGLARDLIEFLGAFGKIKSNSQIGRSARGSRHVDFLPNFFQVGIEPLLLSHLHSSERQEALAEPAECAIPTIILTPSHLINSLLVTPSTK